MPSDYQSIHYSHPIPDLTQSFTITCPPQTDVWEKPPSTHSYNAPIIYKSMPLSSFISARVTVSADWSQQYDQGGLCLVIDPSSPHKQWVKTGIELVNGEPMMGTVVTDRWSDWSLRPLPERGAKSATVQIKAEDDGSLWVYLVKEGGKLSPMREVTWWGDLDKSKECWIGVYAAKPDKDETEFVVAFEGLVMESA